MTRPRTTSSEEVRDHRVAATHDAHVLDPDSSGPYGGSSPPLGYDRTSMRAVARAAGVDSALVAHYFGSKRELFLAVVELPFDPEMVLPALVGGDRSDLGSRFARFVLEVLEDPERRARAVAIVRAAASEPSAADVVRELVSRRIVGAIAAALAADDAELRASLVGSQIVGLIVARHIVGIEPLASLPAGRGRRGDRSHVATLPCRAPRRTRAEAAARGSRLVRSVRCRRYAAGQTMFGLNGKNIPRGLSS